jgi:hypothetical protein
MKLTHVVTVSFTIETPLAETFDPKAHSNYEFIHSRDEAARKVIAQVEFPKNLTCLSIENYVDTTLVLTPQEEEVAKAHTRQEEKIHRLNQRKLEEIADEHDIEYAVWSHDTLAKDLETTFFPGLVKFVYNTSWDEARKTPYQSLVYHNPSYLDAWKEFDKAIVYSNDKHHIFLEGFLKMPQDGTSEITVYDFAAGS